MDASFTIPDDLKPRDALKAVIFEAWQACGGPMNMDMLQDRPGATADDVFSRAINEGDYSLRLAQNDEADVYTDYVFGRMMKTHFQLDGHSLTIRPATPRPDYQGWGRAYRNAEELFNAALGTLRGASGTLRRASGTPPVGEEIALAAAREKSTPPTMD